MPRLPLRRRDWARQIGRRIERPPAHWALLGLVLVSLLLLLFTQGVAEHLTGESGTPPAKGDAVLRLLAAEDRIPAVRRMTEAGRAWHREWVRRTFAPLLTGLRGAERERRLIRLIVATDLLVWKLLRREMGVGRPTAERIVIEMINSTKGAP